MELEVPSCREIEHERRSLAGGQPLFAALAEHKHSAVAQSRHGLRAALQGDAIDRGVRARRKERDRGKMGRKGGREK